MSIISNSLEKQTNENSPVYLWLGLDFQVLIRTLEV